MRKLLFAVLLALACFAVETEPYIAWYETLTDDGEPGVAVHLYMAEWRAEAYRVHLEFTTESGRVMKSSRLVDTKGQKRANTTVLEVMFETGVCKVKSVLIEELAPSRTHVRVFN